MNNTIQKRKLNSNVSVDCVIFGYDFNKLYVLIIKRKSETKPENYRQALPGDLIFEDEDLDMAANRILFELTGLTNIYLEQIGAFGNPLRTKTKGDEAWLQLVREKPTERVITIGYFSLIDKKTCNINVSSFAIEATWVPIHDIDELAFDHNDILAVAHLKLRTEIEKNNIGYNLLPQKFTLSQLQNLYEVVLEKKIDKRNFRKKIEQSNLFKKLDEKENNVNRKASYLYTFKRM